MKARLFRLAISAAFLAGSLAVLVAAASSDAIDNPFSALVAIYITGFIATLIHEAAHAWMARKCGAEIDSIAVIPFSYAPKQRKFAFMRYVPSGDIGGYVRYSFSGDFGTRRDEIAIAASGPAANFLTAAMLLLAVQAWPLLPEAEQGDAETSLVSVAAGQPPVTGKPAMALPSQAEIDAIMRDHDARKRAEERSELIAAFINLLIVVSIVSGILNMLPYKGSDGAIILEHLRSR